MTGQCYPFGNTATRTDQDCCRVEPTSCSDDYQCRGKKLCIDGTCVGDSECEEYCLLEIDGKLQADKDCCVRETTSDLGGFNCQVDGDCAGKRTCESGACAGESGCDELMAFARDRVTVTYDDSCICVPNEVCGKGPGGVPCRIGCTLAARRSETDGLLMTCTREVT